MSDRWTQIWQRQQRQQQSLGLEPNGMSPLAKSRVAKDLSLGLYEEAAELARVATRFKVHILNSQPVEKVDIMDEAADVMKYTIALTQLYDITAEEMVEAFMRKSDVVEHKAAGERFQLAEETPVIMVDMDGCLADLGCLDEQVEAASSVAEQERIKAEFRRGGGYRFLPPIPNAQQGMARLAALGYKLIILTARPHHHYNRLYADTMEWLAEQNIDYDLLLFGRDKAEVICEHIYPAKPRYFIEDRAKHAMEIADLGITVLLMDNPANRSLPSSPFIMRVNDWQGLAKTVSSNESHSQEVRR